MTTQLLRRPDRPTPPKPTSTGSGPASRFRGDIQGLRALAVVSVALDHAQVPGFAGGFVGVDVFFVISGYLITQLLLREAHRTGRVSLADFYARRARRILPAATVTLVVTVIASALLLGYVRAASIVTDTLWAGFFLANVRFGAQQTDYFSADVPPSPIQHFWSLSIEEQFYLVWPVLLLGLLVGAAAFRRRMLPDRDHHTRGPIPTRFIATALGLFGGLSLAWCLWLTSHEPTAAYFSAPARAWELTLGAACATIAPRIARWPASVRVPLGWIGLGLVLAAIFSYTPETAFPGYAALVPTVGTALAIMAGEAAAPGGPRVVLELSWCRRIGDWSYSLYLWHWPFLVIAAGYVGHQLSVGQNLLLLAAATAVSAVSYYYVENPFRRARMLSARAWRGLVVYPLALAVTIAAALVATAVIRNEAQAASGIPPITISEYGAGSGGEADHEVKNLSDDPAVAMVQVSVKAAQNGLAIPGELNPPLLELGPDVAAVGQCEYSQLVRELCERGAVGSDKVLVVLGDSHARAWIPALDLIAKRSGYAVYYLVKPGCNAAMITPFVDGNVFEGCVEFRDWALGQVENLRPDAVILASDLPPGVLDSSGEVVEDPPEVGAAVSRGLVDTIERLEDSAARVIIIGDPPGLAKDPGACLSARGAELADCTFPRSERSKILTAAERSAAHTAGADFIDTLPWFCADTLCPAVVGSTVTYRDTEHLTTEYAQLLSGPLQEALVLG